MEALHRVLQSFDDPTAVPEALGLKLTLVLSHREAALRPFALQDVQPAWKAERDLYAQHKEDYRAQQQQPQQSGLRRSSRAATRASSAAAGRGGRAEVSVVEDAKVRVVESCMWWSLGGVGCGVVHPAPSCVCPVLTHLVPFRPTTPKPPQLLFKFPLEEDEADRVTVTSLDRERLAPGEFLNDNVIDFHFK